MTSSPWKKTVSFTTLPTQAGFSVQPRLKGEPSQDTYVIEADGKMTVTVLDQKGDTFGNPYVGSKLEAKGQLGPGFLGQRKCRDRRSQPRHRGQQRRCHRNHEK